MANQQDSRRSATDNLPTTLFILNALGIGGSERKIVAVTNALNRIGFNVHLAYLDARTPLLSKISSGVSVRFLDRKGRFSFRSMLDLRRYIPKNKIDKVVCINLYPYIYALVAKALLWGQNRPDLILMINAPDPQGLKAALQMRLYRVLMKFTTQIVFGSYSQMDRWHKRYGLSQKKLCVIHNGINVETFSVDKVRQRGREGALDARISSGDFVLGAVGTLWENKNHIQLVELLNAVLTRIPNAILAIAGEGPERARLEEAARKYNLESRVVLLGEIEEVRPFLSRMDVFLLPSIYETFSNATLEAMAMEKVVIVSNTGGMPEMVSDGVNGYLFNCGETERLAELVVMVASNSDRRRSVGQNARRTVSEKFSFDRMVGDYQNLLLK